MRTRLSVAGIILGFCLICAGARGLVKGETVDQETIELGFAKGRSGQLLCYKQMTPLIAEHLSGVDREEEILSAAKSCGVEIIYSRIQYSLANGDLRFLEQQMK